MSYLAKLFNQKPEKGHNRIVIDEKYVITSLIGTQQNFKQCKGIDITQHSYVYVYIKPYSLENNINGDTTKNKQKFGKSICPSIKWNGMQKIGKVIYEIQVHQKYGPSFNEVFSLYKTPITECTFYLLAYQFLKLLQKVFQLGYTCHELNLHNIVFHKESQKSQLFLLNYFDMKKNKQQSIASNQKFNSIGRHLGLNASYKNDLQSMCYILIDIYTNGQFLSLRQSNDYFQYKNTFKISSYPQLPSTFVQFYVFVNNLNHNDQFNLSNWRGAFKKQIPKTMLNQPYQWVHKSILKQSKLQSQNQSIFRINKEDQKQQKKQDDKKSSYSQFAEQISRQNQEGEQLPSQKIEKYSICVKQKIISN